MHDNMNFFISNNGKTNGPFKLADLTKLRITENTLIWQEGTDNWKKAKDIDVISTYIIKSPPPLPNSREDLLRKKYDLSQPQESQLIGLGFGIIVFSIIISIAFSTIVLNGDSTFKIEFSVIGGIISLFLKIWGAHSASESAKRLNRDEMSWGLSAFLFPGITLIILSTKNKLK